PTFPRLRRGSLPPPPAGEGGGGGLFARFHHASTNEVSAAAWRASSIAPAMAPSTWERPAPLTPESGSTCVPDRAAPARARHFSSTASGSIASILLRPTISGLSAKP